MGLNSGCGIITICPHLPCLGELWLASVFFCFFFGGGPGPYLLRHAVAHLGLLAASRAEFRNCVLAVSVSSCEKHYAVLIADFNRLPRGYSTAWYCYIFFGDISRVSTCPWLYDSITRTSPESWHEGYMFMMAPYSQIYIYREREREPGTLSGTLSLSIYDYVHTHIIHTYICFIYILSFVVLTCYYTYIYIHTYNRISRLCPR